MNDVLVGGLVPSRVPSGRVTPSRSVVAGRIPTTRAGDASRSDGTWVFWMDDAQARAWLTLEQGGRP